MNFAGDVRSELSVTRLQLTIYMVDIHQYYQYEMRKCGNRKCENKDN